MTPYRLSALAQGRKGTSVALPIIEERAGAVKEYRKALVGILTELAKETRRSVLTELRRDRGLTVDVANEDWFRALRRLQRLLEQNAVELVARILRTEAEWHTGRFRDNVRRTLGIDLAAVVREEDLEDALRLATARNAALIKSLGDDAIGRVEQIVYAAGANGTSMRAVSEQLTKAFNITKSRADLIAQDQMAGFTADMNEQRQRQAGITKYRWASSQDERVRPLHRRLDGTEYRWGQKTGAEQGLPPGKPIKCFVGSNRFFANHGVKRLFRYWSTTETAQIVTESGRCFEATPNHPMLTSSGWKPVHCLNVGDELIQAHFASALAGDMDVKQWQPSFAQAFEFGRAFAHDRRKAFGGDLYDEVAVDHEIEVVTFPSELGGEFEAHHAEEIGKFILKEAFVSFPALAGGASFFSDFGGDGSSSNRIVRGLRELQLFLIAQSGHSDGVCSTRIAAFYAQTVKEISKRFSAATNAVSDGEDAFPTFVSGNGGTMIEFHSIMGRSIRALDGVASTAAEGIAHRTPAETKFGADVLEHLPAVEFRNSRVKAIVRNTCSQFVYSSETNLGWYSTEEIVSGNCRCNARALVEF